MRESVEITRQAPVAGHYQVVVCGGGPAGLTAAISAARAGRRTALIERLGFLGGSATAGLVVPMSGFFFQGQRVVGGIAWELASRLIAQGAAQVEMPKGHISFFQFSRSITRDVSALAEQILNGSWEDQGGQEEGGYTGNELEIIVSSYHLLLRKFQSAMDSVRQSAQREKRLELSALESQINSHFLYNTLDSINWMAIEGENYEISEMISRLALILRYSISASARVVPFSKELSWLEGHLYIQRRRFNGSFSYDLSIGHETIDFPVRKLILQPFIENAVLHGVRALDRPGLIALSACLQDGGTRLRILIEDNGQGMTPQAVQLYFYHPEQAKAQGHVGIANVLERLKHYYGESYQLTVWSQPGAGTRVTLVLPRADGEE